MIELPIVSHCPTCKGEDSFDHWHEMCPDCGRVIWEFSPTNEHHSIGCLKSKPYSLFGVGYSLPEVQN